VLKPKDLSDLLNSELDFPSNTIEHEKTLFYELYTTFHNDTKQSDRLEQMLLSCLTKELVEQNEKIIEKYIKKRMKLLSEQTKKPEKKIQNKIKLN